LDIYGKVRNFVGRSLSDCPFCYQGQYEDQETGLYYNRFRYYSPEEEMYLSQDPIGLAANNPTLYTFVSDSNIEVDIWGLINLNPYKINYSQRTISNIRVFDASKYEPIRVICDNRRLLSAQNAVDAGISKEIEVEVVDPNDLFPNSKKTWAQKFKERFADPRNVEAGGIVPNTRLKEKPKLKCRG
jgi:RHS repeat-associated protein